MSVAVAISQRVDFLADRNERRDSLDQRLVDWVSALGGLPFPVPNTLAKAQLPAWLEVVQPAAIVLSGGSDIGAFPERDALEQALLDHAEVKQLPVLGLCRGMQVLALRLGAGLHPVSGHVRTRHVLSGPYSGTVNSYHTLAPSCPRDCEVLARSQDGELEAFGHRTLPWQGWMWHPEREPAFTDTDLARGRSWLATGRPLA